MSTDQMKDSKVVEELMEALESSSCPLSTVELLHAMKEKAPHLSHMLNKKQVNRILYRNQPHTFKMVAPDNGTTAPAWKLTKPRRLYFDASTTLGVDCSTTTTTTKGTVNRKSSLQNERVEELRKKLEYLKLTLEAFTVASVQHIDKIRQELDDLCE